MVADSSGYSIGVLVKSEGECTEMKYRSRKFENIAIVLAILSLWPRILRWNNPAFDVVLYACLGFMVLIFIRRLRLVMRGKG